MSTTKNTINRATIAMNLPAKNGDLILYATILEEKMAGNTYFQSPVPSLPMLAAATAALRTAETAAVQRVRGAATVRNEKRTALVSVLQQLRGYVQGVADATPENGASIIESAGFPVRKVGKHSKRAFGAKQGAVSGVAIVTAASAGQRSSYDWEYSVDGGKTWIQVPSTIQGRTTITGLTAGVTVMFRYRAITAKGGTGDWAQPVALLMK